MGGLLVSLTGNLLVITGKVVFVDSNVSRRRADRAQLSVLLDTGLVANVRGAARGRGVSIAAFVEDALEVALHGYVDVRSVGSVGSSTEGVGVRAERGRDSVYGVVSPDSGRGVTPDWDAVFAAGRAAKVPVVVEPVARVIDPIEEIA